MIVSYCRTEEDAIAAMRARAKEGASPPSARLAARPEPSG